MSGGRALIAFVAPLFLVSAIEASPVAVTVSPADAGLALPSCDGEARLIPECPTDVECGEAVRIPLTPGTHEIDLHRSATRWRLSSHSTSCWAWQPDWSRPADPPPILVWPARGVGGTVKVQEGRMPSSLEVTLTSPPGSAIPFAATQRCDVREGRWSCSRPAVPLDLRLEAPGFVPRYVWDLPGDASNGIDLQLIRGASLVGWIRCRGSEPAADAAVELAPESLTLDPSLRAGARVSGRANARGFFQLAPVPAADVPYALTARKEGWSRATQRGIRADRPVEMALDHPIDLTPLAELQIGITPPVDPEGQPWRVRLSVALPAAASYQAVAEEQASPAGLWSRRNLDEGNYLLSVADSRGSVFDRRDLEVSGGSTFVPVSVTTVGIDGTVRAGARPLAADLVFVAGSRRVTLSSDEEGKFEGVLPQEGGWTVKITPPRGFMVIERGVEVKKGTRERAQLDIRLPGGRIEGSVVDEQGHPIQAVLRVRSDRIVAYGETDPGGDFSFVGLTPEPVAVEAVARDGASATVDHLVSEQESPHLRIVIGEQATIRIKLVSSSGNPVSGAIAREFIPPFLRRREEISGPDGSLTVRAPRSAGAIDIVIAAAGFPLKLLAVPTAASGELKIVMTPGGATLAVRVKAAPPWPFIRRGGAFLPLSALMVKLDPARPPMGMVAGGFEAQLDPGSYILCPAPSVSESCRPMNLEPGTRTVIDVREWTPGELTPPGEPERTLR